MSELWIGDERAPAARPPLLDHNEIVMWAEAHHDRMGAWPGPTTPGIIPGTQGEKWRSLDYALHFGGRGLPGGCSLMRLLAERCGVRNRNVPPPLMVEQILAWADCHHLRTGQWPTAT